MARVVRTESYERSLFGKIIKYIFIGFNLFMLFWALSYCSAIGDTYSSADSEAARAGTAIGATLASGMLMTIWAFGVIILGALTFFTRGRKTIVEDTID